VTEEYVDELKKKVQSQVISQNLNQFCQICDHAFSQVCLNPDKYLHWLRGDCENTYNDIYV